MPASHSTKTDKTISDENIKTIFVTYIPFLSQVRFDPNAEIFIQQKLLRILNTNRTTLDGIPALVWQESSSVTMAFSQASVEIVSLVQLLLVYAVSQQLLRTTNRKIFLQCSLPLTQSTSTRVKDQGGQSTCPLAQRSIILLVDEITSASMNRYKNHHSVRVIVSFRFSSAGSACNFVSFEFVLLKIETSLNSRIGAELTT